MATISLRLDTRRANAQGLFPIQFTLSIKGRTTSIGTGISIRAEHWIGEINKAVKPQCPNARAINDSIEKLYFEYSNRLREIDARGHAYSVAELRKVLTEKKEDSSRKIRFIDYMTRYAESRRTDKSTEACLYTLKVIRDFAGDDIAFCDITSNWLKVFDVELAARGISTNTRAIHFRNIRAAFNSAIKEDVIGIETYPFRKFKISASRKDKEALTVEQLRQITAYRPSSKAESIARDLFLLSFYLCGANLIDLYNFGKSKQGRIVFVRTKTSGKNENPVSILIQPEAAAIISEYAGDTLLLRFAEDATCYQTFANSVQKGVRRMARHLNIEGLTFYWARYTWATIADSIGIAEKEIGKGLGHADTSIAGKYYIAYDWTKVDRANRQVIDYVNGVYEV